MSVQEILRKYEEGHRDFRCLDLRGFDFSGKVLSTANFSGADIRSTNFSDAILRYANFSNVKCGLRQRSKWVRWLLVIASGLLAGLYQGIFGGIGHMMFRNWLLDAGVDQIGLSIFFVFCLIVAVQGLTVRSLLFILLVFITAAVTSAIFVFQSAGAVVSICSFAAASVISSASLGAILIVSKREFIISNIVAVLVTFRITVIMTAANMSVEEDTYLFALLVAVVSFIFSWYVGWQSCKGSQRFELITKLGLAIASVKSTYFCGADLTGVSFHEANLSNANFASSRKSSTILHHVLWQKTKGIEKARIGNSILKDRRVRAVLTNPEKGYKGDLSSANLRGSNLNGANLTKANLTRAILSEALVRETVLEEATLTEVQAINTDFTGAYLTGATIEAWNIDSSTTLKKIDCRYIFLRDNSGTEEKRERRPHNPDKSFEPGDFEKLFQEMPDEVQILIRDGINPVALQTALRKIRENYPELSEEAFQGFQKRDHDVLVTVKVPEGTNKAEFERDWEKGYQIGLQAGRKESKALIASAEKRAKSLEMIALALAQNPTPIQNTQNMTMSDRSQTIEVKGNVDGSVIGQGDRNTLSNKPDKPESQDSASSAD